MTAFSKDAIWAEIASSLSSTNPPPERAVAPDVLEAEPDKVIESGTVETTFRQEQSTAIAAESPQAVRQPDFGLDHAQAIPSASFPNPARTPFSGIPATISNIKFMINAYGITIRYNVIKKKLQIALPGNSGTVDNADNVAMITINSLASQNGLALGQIADYVTVLGDRNAYNPVADWIASKPWDGKDRMPEMYATITTREGFPIKLKEAVIYRWQLSAAAAAMVDVGFKARGVLTLQGPQGLGKTSWVRSLVSDDALRETVVKVDHHMDGGSKDSVLGAITHWIVEIGELDSSFKKDIARLKGFLTADFDKVRRPYAHGESEYPRRTVFCATVNESNFLVDTTGNSRWWTIPVTHINYAHGIDMQQVFAQLALDVKAGEQWWLTQAEEALLESCNSEHLSVSVIREQLMEIVDMALMDNPKNPAMTAIEVLTKLGFEYPTNPQCKECAAILRQLFGDSKKIQGQHKWRIPIKPPKPFNRYALDEEGSGAA